MKHTYNFGNNYASKKKGKTSVGSGRHPDWYIQKCRNLLDKYQLIEFLADVGRGADVEPRMTPEQKVVLMPAAVKYRISAIEVLMDKGQIKSAENARNAASVIIDEIRRRYSPLLPVVSQQSEFQTDNANQKIH